jgi:ubiquinone/menaquinone biosynthesis C-methylase UbiE
MNAAELAANPRLDEYVVQDLNQQPRLAFDDRVFDGAGLCVSIQYLTRPVEVLREVGRVLRPAAPLVITFSNRCFPTKAVAIWLALDNAGRGRLVKHYLTAAGNWMAIERLDRSPGRRDTQHTDIRRHGDGNTGDDPLFAVVARRRPGRAADSATLHAIAPSPS